MTRIAGVDGCPGGWLCVVMDVEGRFVAATVFRTAAELLAHDPRIQAMAIDMPIGLAHAGRRRCDEVARERLKAKAVCVSNAPLRPALYAPSRVAASAISHALCGRKVGAQEWSLYPKVINLDRVLTPLHQRWCFEVHPELSFAVWSANGPLAEAKDTPEGRRRREELIDGAWRGARLDALADLGPHQHGSADYALDDVNDAFAAVWTARRIVEGKAERIPDMPEIDGRGLRIEMWI